MCVDTDPTCPSFIGQFPETCSNAQTRTVCALSCNACPTQPPTPATAAPTEATCTHDGTTFFADIPGCGRVAASSGVAVACADATFNSECPATCRPCHAPTAAPTSSPTSSPTMPPSAVPTLFPTTGTPSLSPVAQPTLTPSAAPTISSCNGVGDPAICQIVPPISNCTDQAFSDVCLGLCGTCIPVLSCNGVSDPAICQHITSVRNCDVIGANLSCPGRCGTCIPVSSCNGVNDPPICQLHDTNTSCESTAGLASVCPGRCGTCTPAPTASPTASPLPLQNCSGVLDPAGCGNPLLDCNDASVLASCMARCNNCPATTTSTSATSTTTSRTTISATSVTTITTATTGHFGCDGVADPPFCARESFNCVTTGAQLWCPVKCNTCVGVRITRPPTQSPTTRAPTITPTSVPTTCSGILCSNDCRGTCGWSRKTSLCVPGGRTTASEVNLGDCAGGVNCATILCSNDCTGSCGWSRSTNLCKAGAHTSASEANLGNCTLVSGTAAPSSQAQACGLITCSNDCVGACGWSSRKGVCKLGGRTTASERNLGTGCT